MCLVKYLCMLAQQYYISNFNTQAKRSSNYLFSLLFHKYMSILKAELVLERVKD